MTYNGLSVELKHCKTTASSSPAIIDEYKFLAHELTALTLTERQLCDLELLLNGGFAPLTGFMSQADYESVLATMRLADGSLWPMPITLDVDAHFADEVQAGQEIALRDAEGLLLAILRITDIWEANKERESEAIFNTQDLQHAGVRYLKHEALPVYVGGQLVRVSLPIHYDFTHLRFTPVALKQHFQKMGWEKVVAFQTRNPIHRAHQELTLRAAQQTGANILLHPVAGMTKPGDIAYDTRVRCYEQVLKTYPSSQPVFLSLLPLAMRMAGPKEALWHALIRKNYGCTHFIVGRDHAGPGVDSRGKPFYSADAAQSLALRYQQEMNIEIVPFQEILYSSHSAKYYTVDELPRGETPLAISGTELRERLQKGLEIPEWFSAPGVIQELRKANPLKHEQGFTVFFTGLPSAGKSTLANGLALKIREITHRQVTILDGDIIRTHLSRGLGFSEADRELNIVRVGFVAKEITKHGGVAICALVAPFIKAREKVRQMIAEAGGYIEVYVSTPLSVCEARDRKGMYKKAREGVIKQFTGVTDVYEIPVKPEIKIETTKQGPGEIINDIIEQIKYLGYLKWSL